MRLFTPENSNHEIINSLGLGLIMIHGSRVDVRNKLDSLENYATCTIKNEYSFDFSISLKNTELGVVYNNVLYITSEAQSMALQEYQRLTGIRPEVVNNAT